MPHIRITSKNPYGLSIKQQAVIDDILFDISQRKGFSLAKSVAKFYRVKNKRSAYSIASQNLSKLNFKEALLNELKNNKLIGKGGSIEQKLTEGLEAMVILKDNTGRSFSYPDFKTRLEYIKEINKITGLY